MTLDYASPEQIKRRGELTTATDIYSLGVVLYDLLVGSSHTVSSCNPLRSWSRRSLAPSGQLRAALYPRSGPLEWVCTLCVFAQPRLLSGDLDAVISKAMNVSPRLALVARPRPFARTCNGTWTAGPWACSPSKALIGARVPAQACDDSHAADVTDDSLVRCDDRRHLQCARRTHPTAASRHDARLHARHLQQNSPEKTDGTRLTAVELLARSGKRLDTEFRGDPVTKAVLLTEIGNVYLSLGLHDEARSYANRAIALLEPVRTQFALDYLTAVDLLAEVLSESNAWSEAIDLANQSIPFARANPQGHDAWAGRFLGHRAMAQRQLGALGRSEEDTVQALAEMKASGAEHTEYYVNTLNDLGTLYLDQGNDRRALEIFLEFAKRDGEISAGAEGESSCGRIQGRAYLQSFGRDWGERSYTRAVDPPARCIRGSAL